MVKYYKEVKTTMEIKDILNIDLSTIIIQNEKGEWVDSYITNNLDLITLLRDGHRCAYEVKPLQSIRINKEILEDLGKITLDICSKNT